MDSHALYDVLLSFKDIHKVVLNLADGLNDEQLNWKPEGYSTSIGFHLWHLGRESDYLKAALLQHYPLIGSDFGDANEIWMQEELAKKWGFPAGTHETVGTGLSDEVAASLPIPKKDELLDYLRASYSAIEQFVELLDTRYSNFEQVLAQPQNKGKCHCEEGFSLTKQSPREVGDCFPKARNDMRSVT